MAWLFPGPLRWIATGCVCEERLALDLLVEVFFFALPTAPFVAELARFVGGFPAAFLRSSALSDLDFADAATGFFFTVVSVCAADFFVTWEFPVFCGGLVFESTGFDFVTTALLARTALALSLIHIFMV